MKFGLHMMVATRYFAEIASIAEELGFDTLFVPEHLVFPAEMPASYPYTDDGVLLLEEMPKVKGGMPVYDPFVELGYLAACTSTIRLATGIAIAPLRHPLVLARALGTVDRFSNGRVTLGLGVGWLEEEFTAVGESFHDRGPRTDAIIELLRELWTSDVIERHDEHFDFGPVTFRPKPLQREGIPIHVGGSSRPALRRAGRLGDGWLEIGNDDLDDVLSQLALVQEARIAAGRDHLPFEVTTTDKVVSDRDTVERAADAGITRVAMTPQSIDGGDVTPQSFAEWGQRFRDEMMGDD